MWHSDRYFCYPLSAIVDFYFRYSGCSCNSGDLAYSLAFGAMKPL